MALNILAQIEKLEDKLIGLRRHLHENPELSGFEFKTLELIRNRLTELEIPFIECPAGGILGFVENGNSGRTVLLRGDIDALPVTESAANLCREKTVVSKVEGASHICGHDAHTANMLAAAEILRKNREFIDGKVILCFERAEENGGPDRKYGARALLNFFKERNWRIDSCFAIHVNPEMKSGTISANEGAVMAGGGAFRAKIIGSSGHAARPDRANHPLDCFVAFYQALLNFRLKHASPFTPLTISVPVVNTGTQRNVIDDELTFSGTVRFFRPEIGEMFEREFRRALGHIAAAYHCEHEVEICFTVPPVVNDKKSSRVARGAVAKYIGEERLTVSEPLMASEPMGLYLSRYTGTLAFLGIANDTCGSGAELHNARFDIDEAALKYGVAAYVGYALDSLSV
ncbi:MAG: amidohydrolase [Synergistaceae bacterium]|jgi:amidohydrolase|nr:amidohydrolase [Synergistaceae bacterium]